MRRPINVDLGTRLRRGGEKYTVQWNITFHAIKGHSSWPIPAAGAFFLVPLTLIFPRDPPTTYPMPTGAGTEENQKNFNPEASYQGVSSSCSFPPDFYSLLPTRPSKDSSFTCTHAIVSRMLISLPL